MRWIGLDVHKKETEVCILDPKGRILERMRIPTTRHALLRFAQSHLGQDASLALEATTNTWGIADILAPHCARLVVSNPMRTRAIAAAKVKTDKVDALVLAQLLRTGFLPEVWVPDQATRHMRALTSHRAVLVADVTRLKNRIHAVLHQRLIQAPVTRLFGHGGRAFLESFDLDPIGRETIDTYLRLLQAAEGELQRVNQKIASIAYRREQIRLLMTIPGVHVTVASALLAALGDISRFPDGDHAASYLGLVPKTRQSAEHCYHGPITKHGNAHARWLLVQAAQHLDRHPGPLGVFFRKIMRKKNRNVAVVATARKLVLVAWHMLTKNEPYRYALPRQTQEKLASLRRAAGHKRPPGGIPKGSKRPSSYGSGIPTRYVPSLAEACAAEDVPPPQPLRPGELRMVEKRGLRNFLDSLASSRREPRLKKHRQPLTDLEKNTKAT